MALLMFRSPITDWMCTAIFVVAAATDSVDGYVARKQNQVTNFGKFVDPLADKLLITAALVGFVQLNKLDAWIATLIIAREFIVTSLRLVAVSEGKIIAASSWGKVKTVSQIVAIISLLFDRIFLLEYAGLYLSTVFVMIALILTVVSGWMYVASNWKLLEFK
jgi:CDP-diacylglycerol--glycerol-3-phosphate 3-phosphatidyltransferase